VRADLLGRFALDHIGERLASQVHQRRDATSTRVLNLVLIARVHKMCI
jgi:hypothetical protein